MSERRAPYGDASRDPLIIALPWMDYSALRPNSGNREGYSRIARRQAAASARQDANLAAKVQDAKLPCSPVKMLAIFYAPDKRRRDLDGMLSAIKPYIDGIFEACGRDDSEITMIEIRKGKPRKGGRVYLEFTTCDAGN